MSTMSELLKRARLAGSSWSSLLGNFGRFCGLVGSLSEALSTAEGFWSWSVSRGALVDGTGLVTYGANESLGAVTGDHDRVQGIKGYRFKDTRI